MPNWEGSTRRTRLPKNWPTIREGILMRDGYACTWIEDGIRCNARANQVDHITPGDNDDPANLRSLCAHHHQLKSSAEGGKAERRRSRYHSPRPTQPHPGLKKTTNKTLKADPTPIQDLAADKAEEIAESASEPVTVTSDCNEPTP